MRIPGSAVNGLELAPGAGAVRIAEFAKGNPRCGGFSSYSFGVANGVVVEALSARSGGSAFVKRCSSTAVSHH